MQALPTAVVRTLLSRISAGSRTSIALLAVLGLGARVGVVVTALTVSAGEARLATMIGVAVAVLFGVQRVIQARLRVRVECELYGASARALVRSDVLTVHATDPSHVLFGGSGQARALLVDVLPAVSADVLTTVLVAPVVLRELPLRVLGVAALGLVIALALVGLLRRSADRLQARALERYQDVVDTLLVAVEGRLEVVARGGEDAYARMLDRTLASYAALAERAALGLALLGRAPLFFAILAVAASVAIDGALREVFVAAVLGQALVLAAILPAFVGVVGGVYEIARSGPPSRELVTLLTLPERPELARGGDAPPAAPAAVEVSRASFAYSPDGPRTLEDVSFLWTKGAPMVLAGTNGSGKTTVLRLLLGLRTPTRGAVSIGGQSLETMDLIRLRQSVAFLPQRPYLGEPYTTVRHALALACPDAGDDAMLRVLGDTGVRQGLDGRGESALDVRVGELSAGQRQRVALARVLLQDAPLVMLDEPEANLDRDGVALVSSVVDSLVRDGKMVVVAAHAPAIGTNTERVDLPARDQRP